MFRTGYDEAPFAILGTRFLVGYRGGHYLITTNHGLGQSDPRRLVVYPASREPEVATRNWWRVAQDLDDPDSTDLFVLEIDPSSVNETVDRIGRAIDLSPQNTDAWKSERWESTFFVTGYPAIANNADYDRSQVKTAQVLLPGRYARPWKNGSCHEIICGNPQNLENFNGFSGSPVFSCLNTIAVAMPTRFCGIAIRATASSRRVHFLESSTIILALEEVAASR